MVGPTEDSVNPLHNSQRLAALNALRNDAINNLHLARLVGLTARVLGASYAMISLIDANQQSVISSHSKYLCDCPAHPRYPYPTHRYSSRSP
jgi:hypothetical protein